MIQKIKNVLIRIYTHICRILFGYKNAVVFESFSGKSYSDNPRATSEKLHELHPDIKIVWFFKDPKAKQNLIPDYIKCIDTNNKFAVLKWLSTAKCVVNNCGLSDVSKGKKQYFVQVWHGDRAFKKILHDSSFASQDFKLIEEKDGFCDLAVSGSKYGEMQFRSAFRYKGEILKVGIPRNDALINIDKDKIQSIKKNLGINSSKKIILYAPTLRRENSNSKTLQKIQNIDLIRTLDALKKRTNNDWVFLIRSHPSISGLTCDFNDSRIIDASSYEDMADLLLVSDFLITDYSSSAGDFALLHKPIILYQSDKNEYLKNDRTFYFNIEDSPYFVAENQEELEKLIGSVTDIEFEKNCDDILKFYDTYETGKASEYLVEKIYNSMR